MPSSRPPAHPPGERVLSPASSDPRPEQDSKRRRRREQGLRHLLAGEPKRAFIRVRFRRCLGESRLRSGRGCGGRAGEADVGGGRGGADGAARRLASARSASGGRLDPASAAGLGVDAAAFLANPRSLATHLVRAGGGRLRAGLRGALGLREWIAVVSPRAQPLVFLRPIFVSRNGFFSGFRRAQPQPWGIPGCRPGRRRAWCRVCDRGLCTSSPARKRQ